MHDVNHCELRSTRSLRSRRSYRLKEDSINGDEHSCQISTRKSLERHAKAAHSQVTRKSVDESKTQSGPSQNLKSESENVMTVQESSLTCRKCDKNFESKGSLVRHMEVHSGECHASSSVNGNVGKTHKSPPPTGKSSRCGENQFKCNQCDRSFMLKHLLLSHLKTHRRQPTKCDVCSKNFGSSKALKMHMRKHSREKSDECTRCDDQSINSLGSSQEHERIELEQKRFKCEYCDLSFSTSRDLGVHKATHSVEKPFICKECDDRFDTVSNFLTHIKTHQGEKESFTGSESGKIIEHKSDQQRHTLMHKKDQGGKPPQSMTKKTFQCADCDKSFFTYYSFKIHLRRHTGDVLFPCNICKMCFYDNSTLKRHMRTHTGEKPFVCDDCGKTFYMNYQLVRHKRTHMRKDDRTNSKETISICCKESDKECSNGGHLSSHLGVHKEKDHFECSKCRASFKDEGDLHTHVSVEHHGERPFQCEECGKCFKANCDLKKHAKIHTKEKLFLCSECGKSFFHNSQLQRHMIIHRRERLFKCNVCGKRFFEKRVLLGHMTTHAERKRLFQCNVCGKTFFNNSYLQSHKRKHTRERLFQCDKCEKGFFTKWGFQNHAAIHTEERLFECNVCGKKFTLKGYLTKHLKIHTGERTHVCSACGLGFYNSGNLSRHMLTHSGEKRFKCQECGASFTRKQSLTSHMYLHNNPERSVIKCCKVFTSHASYVKHLSLSGRCGNMSNGKKSMLTCSICSQNVVSAHLTQHWLSHTEKDSHKCVECGEEFVRRDQLYVHLLTHRREMLLKQCNNCDYSGNKCCGFHEAILKKEQRAIFCPECGKFFSSKFTLQGHLLKHRGERPFKCSECGKSFGQKFQYKCHMRSKHMSESFFSCNQCGKVFVSQANLSRHMLKYRGENDDCQRKRKTSDLVFSCNQCGKTFSTRYNLSRHTFKHMGKKDFKCEECGMAFYDIYALKSHKRRHTGEKPYKCSVCYQCFTEKRSLHKHMRKHSGPGDNVLIENCRDSVV